MTNCSQENSIKLDNRNQARSKDINCRIRDGMLMICMKIFRVLNSKNFAPQLLFLHFRLARLAVTTDDLLRAKLAEVTGLRIQDPDLRLNPDPNPTSDFFLQIRIQPKHPDPHL